MAVHETYASWVTIVSEEPYKYKSKLAWQLRSYLQAIRALRTRVATRTP